MSRLIALDFESTGLFKQTDDFHQQPGIVEIGAVSVEHDHDKWLEADALSKLIDPECHYEEEAQKVSGLTPEDLIGAPNLRTAFAEFAEFFCGADTLITYNGAYFDIPLLQYNLKKYGLETRFPWPWKQIDVMLVATDVMNMPSKMGNKYPKLTELHEYLFGEGYDNAHRAVQDAQATMNCAMKLVEQGHIVL